MKKITFLLFFALIGFYSIAQTTVTIGTGTLSASGVNATPVYRSSAASTFNFSQSVELLTPADLSAVGITAGSTITKIAYKKLNAFTLSAGRTATMKIYMKNSSTTAFGTTTNFATYTTGSTLCYNNAAYSNADLPAAAGWVEFNFGTPFNYTGGSIEVGIDWAINTGTGNASDGAFAWEYTTVTANQAVGTSNSVAITGNLTTANTRLYNTQLTFTNTPCVGTPAPGNTLISTSGCFGSSATLYLQNATVGSGVTYQWYMDAVAISGATNPTYVIPSVSTSGTYFCEVTCAGNMTPSSSLLVSPSVLNAPLLEPFATFLPSCWTNMFGGDLTTGPTASTGSGWVADGFANSGTTGAIRNEIWTTGANDWVISPVINIPATGYELKFDAAATQFGSVNAPTNPWESDDYIEVLVATGGSTTNWSVVYTYNDTNLPSNAGASNIIDLSSFAGQNIRVAFHAVEGASNGTADIDFSIDNFQVRLTPACSEPTGIVTANVTSSSIDMSWTAPAVAPSVGYEYFVSTSNTVPVTAGTSTANTFATPTGLTGNTTYYIFVRSDCGVAGFSSWVGPVTFTTACSPFTTFPFLEPFNTFLPNQCWMNGVNGDLTSGPAAFTASGWGADGLANVGTTGAIRNNIYTTGANDWVISPQFTIPATGYELKFVAAAVQYAGTGAPTTPWEADDAIEVLVSSTGTTNWTPLYTYNDTNQPGITATANTIDLDAYSGQTVRFAFRATEGTADGSADIDFSIDNFEIRLSPTCPDQTGLVVSNVGAFTADTSWNDMAAGGALGYEYAITTSATPPASGTATTAIFYQATGLTAQTVYYLHVRSSCAAGTFGNWASTSFTTACAPITALPHLEPFNTFLPNQCWMNGVNGDLTAGPAAFTASGWGADGLANVGTTGAIRNNIYTTGANDWVISPQFTIPATGYELKFVAAAVQFAGTGAPTTPWEADDAIEVLVSSTGTTNWTPLYTYNDTNQPGITATANTIDLDAYSGQTVRFAFRATEGATDGSADIDFSIDNFEIRLSPTCPDQTGLVVSNVGAFTADTSWNDMAAGGALGYEYAITTSATPPASGTATTAIFYQATGLTAQTVYYLHVRSSCAAGTFGNWATTSFTTACAPVTALPWNEGFEGLSTVGTTSFPPCWFKENGDWASQNTNGTYSTSNTGTRYIRDSWSATNEYIWTPGFDLVAGTSYDFSSFVQGDNGTGWVVDYFVNSSQISTGATQLGGSYNVPGTGSTYAFQPYALVKRSFVPATSGTYYFAVRVNQSSSAPWYVSFDDFKLELSPACSSPSASASPVADVTATLSWAAVPSAALGYEYVLDNVATDPAGSGTSTTALSYGATGLTQLTTYYFHIRSVCSAGTYSPWSTISFTTTATPPVNDNCASAITLIPGALPTTNPVATTNVGATNSNPPAPGCANFLGGDVWFTVTVPASGNISLETITGTVTDTGLAVYSGTCGALTLVDCDDDSALNAGSNSFISLTGHTPGEVLYVNAWDYGNNNFGTFSVTAYDASLSAASFDTSNFVAYPNPVKDVLNLSYKTAISNVRIVNLLGQEVLNTKTNTNDVQVNMSALTAGAYIVNITVEDTVHTIKVIKE